MAKSGKGGRKGKRTQVGGGPKPPKPPRPPRPPSPFPPQGNLGQAVPTAQTRQRVQSGFLSSLLGLADQGLLKAETARKKARQQLRGQIGFLRTVTAAIGRGANNLIAGALGRIRQNVANIAGTGQALFDTPVSQLRSRPSAAMLPRTAGGADMIGVSSSNVFSVGYDDPDGDGRGTLTIQFRRGARVYEYYDAPIWLRNGILASRSPGRYVHDFVRQLYDGTSLYRRIQ